MFEYGDVRKNELEGIKLEFQAYKVRLLNQNLPKHVFMFMLRDFRPTFHNIPRDVKNDVLDEWKKIFPMLLNHENNA